VEGRDRDHIICLPKRQLSPFVGVLLLLLTDASQPASHSGHRSGESDACFRAALRPTLIYPWRCSPAHIQREKSRRHFSLLCQRKVRPLASQSLPQTVVIAISPLFLHPPKGHCAPSGWCILRMSVLCARISPWDDNHTSSFGSLHIPMSPPLQLLIAQQVRLCSYSSGPSHG
jgi:hypothetical protein